LSQRSEEAIVMKVERRTDSLIVFSKLSTEQAQEELIIKRAN